MNPPPTNTCPRVGEVERAFPRGLDEALHEHLAGCAPCTATWSALARVAAVAKELAPAPASTDRREQLRTTLLAKAEASPVPRVASRGVAWGAAALLVAATSIALLVAGSQRGTSPSTVAERSPGDDARLPAPPAAPAIAPRSNRAATRHSRAQVRSPTRRSA